MKYIQLFVILITAAAFGQLTPIKYDDGGKVLNGMTIQPKEGTPSKPGILIIPAWMGIDDHAKDTANQLAALGYYAFVADIYGEGNNPKNQTEAGKTAGYYKQHRAEYQKRVALALQQLIKSGAVANNIAIIGYCFGGMGALDAARTGMNVRAAVAIHGALGRDESSPIKTISAKVLALQGADDPYVLKAEQDAFQQEMRNAKADWQMIYYSDAVHAFTDPSAGNDNSKGAAYNERQANRAWEHLKVFLAEELKK